MKSTAIRIGATVLPTLAVLLFIEWGRQGLGIVPVPFLLLLVAVGGAGYVGGAWAGGISGALAALYILFCHLVGYGPETLTGPVPYTMGGMALYVLSGMILGRLRDDRDRHYLDLLETRRKEQEEPLKLASQLVGLGYYIWDPVARKPIVISDQHIRNYGISLEEFLAGASYAGGDFPLVHPEDREKVDGWCRQLDAGELVEMEYRVLGNDSTRWIRAIVRPILDDSGQCVRQVCASQDITTQKATEAHLLETQKMESIGLLTGGIAHDFNNMLSVVLGNLELLRDGLQDEGDLELIDAAIAASHRGAGLTRSMLSFARRAPLRPTALDLNVVVRQAETWMRRALPESISVEVSLLAGLWPVTLDPTSLESALLNLLVNARDAMDGQGRLTIETANVRIDRDYVDTRGERLSPGRYVLLAVSDTGTGIAPDSLQRIFDPFYTTKAPGAGSGIGLSMVQGFVRQSLGTVQVYTQVGIGTTFKLYFPAGEAKAPAAPVPADAVDQKRPGAARVLLVEDEAGVRDVLRTVLRNSGHDVIEASSGDAAMAIFRADRAFDLVVTDIVMPGTLQGTGLAREIRKTHPDLPFIFLSGYAAEATVHGNGLSPGDIRLMKPVPKAELLDAVSAILASASREN